MTLTPAEVHRRLVDSYPDILAGRVEHLLELIDPDVVDHRGGAQGDHTGREAWREKWAGFAENGTFHGVTVTVEQNVADGRFSVNRYRSSGIHTESGRRYEVISMDMIRVEDGRLVEHWALRDTDSMREQLGLSA